MPKSNTAVRHLGVNNDPHAVPAVPEVAERVPVGQRGLPVAAVVPGAREEGDVAGALGLVLVAEAAPRVRVALRAELRRAPAPALVGGDLDALDRAFADPGLAAHGDRLSALEVRVGRGRGDHRLDRP